MIIHRDGKTFVEVPDDSPTHYKKMPKDLEGYWWETDTQICVPVVSNKHEGNGAFSDWLKRLERKHKLIFFPTIVSARLDAILRKKGYIDGFVNDAQMGFIDGLVYCPSLRNKENG
jgi:hypothetical protein